MEIKYFGENRIYLKGKKENVWINPSKGDFDGKSNDARVVIFTEKERNFVKLGEEASKVVICGPGEYEIGGVEINGVNSMYALTVDGIKLVIVGKIEGEITEKKKEKLEEADVLLVSVGDIAVDVAKKSAANYVIPVDFESKEKDLKTFLDAFDSENLESIEALKVDKDNLPEGMEVVLLKTMQ
ncbi:MAG TPA: MBL fold metallo-hydrolase [Candidatus Methanoperedens sp.]|nr:MBL fold metallo-hydrolase [Candidatus Methanoperedens sp.]